MMTVSASTSFKISPVRHMCPGFGVHHCIFVQNTEKHKYQLYVCSNPKITSISIHEQWARLPKNTTARAMSRVFHIKLLRQRASTSPLYFSHSNNVSPSYQKIQIPSMYGRRRRFLLRKFDDKPRMSKTTTFHAMSVREPKIDISDVDESCAFALSKLIMKLHMVSWPSI